MPYNEDFYTKYRSYLLEPAVRRAHNLMFEQFHLLTSKTPLRVIDLGCGTCEFKVFSYCQSYTGFDLYPLDDQIIIADVIKTPPDALAKMCRKWHNPTAFISLFSSESIMEDKNRYELYEKLFRQIPTLHFGMVSGFYYQNRSYYHIVEEPSGIISYQTNECQDRHINPLFIEFRSYIEVPSEFFGKDVVEVWKFFRRNPSNELHTVLQRNGSPSGLYSVASGPPEDFRSNLPTTVSSSDHVPVAGHFPGGYPQVRGLEKQTSLKEPEVSSMTEVTRAIGLLLLGVACVVFGRRYGDEIGMVIGGIIGVLLVNRLITGEIFSGWLWPVIIRVRKFALGKSDPDYFVPDKWVKPKRPWAKRVHAVFYKGLMKLFCYFDWHEPINMMENGHIFQRCDHCKQLIQVVMWDVNKSAESST